MGQFVQDYLLEFIRTDSRPTFIFNHIKGSIVYRNLTAEGILADSHDVLLSILQSAAGSTKLIAERAFFQIPFGNYIVNLRIISPGTKRDGYYVGTIEFRSSSEESLHQLNIPTPGDENKNQPLPHGVSTLASPRGFSSAQDTLIRYNGGILPRLDWTRANCPIPFGDARKHYNLLHSIDWSATPVGPMSSWSTSLRATVNAIMYMTQPIVLYAGYDYINIYNLAWGLLVAQERHPFIMGKTVPVAWPEGCDYLVPLIDKTLLGEIVIRDAALFFLNKSIPGEESYVSFILSPAVDNNGGFLGCFAYAVFETDTIIKKRHTRMLQTLSAKLVHVKDLDPESDFWAVILDSLDESPHDSPFVILYRVSEDGRRCRYMGSKGLDSKVCGNIDLDALGYTPSQVFKERLIHTYGQKGYVREALSASELSQLEGMPYRGFGVCNDAITLPIRKHSGVVQAFVIVGQNHRRPFDMMYQDWLTSFHNLLITSVAKIWSVKDEERLQLESKLAGMVGTPSLVSSTIGIHPNVWHETHFKF
ncbi:hypothetical protein ABW19_dt0203193 [Dactylella cylindrospora]|nr:hypothetical protein ABW19_dt0203193 [Dactylella cylindrospora]